MSTRSRVFGSGMQPDSHPAEMVIRTYNPGKWLAVDLAEETVWTHDGQKWTHAEGRDVRPVLLTLTLGEIPLQHLRDLYEDANRLNDRDALLEFKHAVADLLGLDNAEKEKK